MRSACGARRQYGVNFCGRPPFPPPRPPPPRPPEAGVARIARVGATAGGPGFHMHSTLSSPPVTMAWPSSAARLLSRSPNKVGQLSHFLDWEGRVFRFKEPAGGEHPPTCPVLSGLHRAPF